MKKIIGNPWFKWTAFILLVSCSGGRKNQNPGQPVSAQPQQSSRQAQPQNIYYFNDQNNVSVGEIDLGSQLYFKLDNTSLRRVEKNGKSKYRDPSNQTVYEIKYSDDGFKLRTPTGQLLWKVKYKNSKIKLANNEEMKDAYEISQKGESAVIKKNDTLVENLDLGEGTIPVIVKSPSRTLMISGPSKNPVFAILTLKDIPADQQMVLIMEVLLKDQ